MPSPGDGGDGGGAKSGGEGSDGDASGSDEDVEMGTHAAEAFVNTLGAFASASAGQDDDDEHGSNGGSDSVDGVGPHHGVGAEATPQPGKAVTELAAASAAYGYTGAGAGEFVHGVTNVWCERLVGQRVAVSPLLGAAPGDDLAASTDVPEGW